jgi:chromosome segregation ATPase
VSASAVRDVLAFAEKLRAAVDVVDRADSLEQAVRESEERLKALRAAEKVVKTEVEANRERAHQAEEGAKVQAKAILDAAYAEAGKRRAETKAACEAELREARSALERLDVDRETRLEAVRSLEAEEAKLGQSVAALRADLAALKARLG